MTFLLFGFKIKLEKFRVFKEINKLKITLDERLNTCAEFVRENAVLADVGTDHAYLPAFLILNGKIKSALACDINELPLKSAESTITENGINDKVKLRLCNGLCDVDKDEFADLVIAGMGGELIVNILSACNYIKNQKYRLILQPMSKAEILRKYLAENGFEIIDEKAAVSNKKVYTVICAEYCGKPYKANDEFLYFGKLLSKNDKNSTLYKEKIKRSLKKQANGILSADSENLYAKNLLSLLDNIDNK